MDSDYDDLDEDIERLKIVLQDDGENQGEESDGELRGLEDGEIYVEYEHSRPSTSSDVTASSFPTTSVCTDADEGFIRFDPSTITAETCLAMNRAYQEVLLDTLRQVEISLAENRAKQRQRESDLADYSSDKPTRGKELRLVKYSVPFFKDSKGQCPPANEDSRVKETLNEEKQHVKAKVGWSLTQRQLLVSAVKMDALEHRLRPLLNKLEIVTSKASTCKTTEEIEANKARIQELTAELEVEKKTPGDVLLETVDENKIDFMKIAVVHFFDKFDGVECECMWKNVLRPGINKERWTADEDKQLAELVDKHKMRNWKRIADELGTCRTPFQCLQHYQKKHFDYDKSEWTEAEDELLKEVVETCRYGTGKILWHQVAYYIDRRSARQCELRFKNIDVNTKKGKWNELEDMLLLAAVETLGASCDWTVVQEFVPGRNSHQCKDRYINSLSDKLNFNRFTYEEDRQIMNGFDNHGNDWKTILSKFKLRRTCTMLMKRFKKLLKWQDMTESFFKQPENVQQKMLHPAFTLGEKGGFHVKDAMLLSQWTKQKKVPKKRGRKKQVKPNEGLKLRAEAKKLLDDNKLTINNQGFVVKQEGVIVDDDDSLVPDGTVDGGTGQQQTETTAQDGEEQAGPNEPSPLEEELKIFLNKVNVSLEDYDKQNEDREQGVVPVPRPPPINQSSLRFFSTTLCRRAELEDIVKDQVDYYMSCVKDMPSDGQNVARTTLEGLVSISDGQRNDVRGAISSALGASRPSDLTVRELLNISRSMTRKRGPKKRNKLEADGEDSESDDPDWEPEPGQSPDEDIDGDESDGDESDDEYFARLQQEADKQEKELEKMKKPRRKMSEKFRENRVKVMKAHGKLQSDLRSHIRHKLNLTERGKKRRMYMFPKRLMEKSRCLPHEEKRINNKSLMLLLKSLDVDCMSMYGKAKQCNRNIAAMAMLRSTDRIKKTRSQTAKIPNQLSHLHGLSEVSETVLQLRGELKLTPQEEADMETRIEAADVKPSMSGLGPSTSTGMGAGPQHYTKCLPYIPPNKTNLGGLKSLLVGHKSLIDQAGHFFNAEELKAQLYHLKSKGPNPLMNVLNAMGRTEDAIHDSKKKKKKIKKAETLPVEQMRQQLIDIRQSYAYKQLMARFHSVFTWPALMSTITPPKTAVLPKGIHSLIEQHESKPTSKDLIKKMKTFAREGASASFFGKNGLGNDDAADAMGDDEDDGETDGAEVYIDKEEVSEDDEEEPEEAVIEKLVQKIMKEYDNSRNVRRPRLKIKHGRKDSDKMKEGREKRKRTMILKQLGLYEKMREYEKNKEKTAGHCLDNVPEIAESSLPGEVIPANSLTREATASCSATESTGTSDANLDGKYSDQPSTDSAADSSNTPKVIPIDQATSSLFKDGDMESEANEAMDTEETAAPGVSVLKQNVDAAETSQDSELPVKRKRGRQPGTVLQCYGKTTASAVRKSSRTTDVQVKKPQRPYEVTLKRLKTIVPEKMGKLVSKISDVPILHEPIPEPKPKKKKLSKTEDAGASDAVVMDAADDAADKTQDTVVGLTEETSKQDQSESEAKKKGRKKKKTVLQKKKEAMIVSTELKKVIQLDKSLKREAAKIKKRDKVIKAMATKAKEAKAIEANLRKPGENDVEKGEAGEQTGTKQATGKHMVALKRNKHTVKGKSKTKVKGKMAKYAKSLNKAKMGKKRKMSHTVIKTKRKRMEMDANTTTESGVDDSVTVIIEDAIAQVSSEEPETSTSTLFATPINSTSAPTNATPTIPTSALSSATNPLLFMAQGLNLASQSSSASSSADPSNPTTSIAFMGQSQGQGSATSVPNILGAMMYNPAQSQAAGYGPIMVPIPVGDSQQVAYMPLFPNSEGKYTFPDGKELEINMITGPGGISLPSLQVGNTGTVNSSSSTTDIVTSNSTGTTASTTVSNANAPDTSTSK